jgi:hypothetical protein
MTPPVFANAQAILVDYLRDTLATLDDPDLTGLVIGARVPATRTLDGPPLLVVRRSGGPAVPPVLDRPRLDIMVWHATEYQATAVASVVRGLLLYDLPGQVHNGHTIYQPTEFSGPSPYPDPAGSSTPIVMFTLEVPIRVAPAPAPGS